MLDAEVEVEAQWTTVEGLVPLGQVADPAPAVDESVDYTTILSVSENVLWREDKPWKVLCVSLTAIADLVGQSLEPPFCPSRETTRAYRTVLLHSNSASQHFDCE